MSSFFVNLTVPNRQFPKVTLKLLVLRVNLQIMQMFTTVSYCMFTIVPYCM